MAEDRQRLLNDLRSFVRAPDPDRFDDLARRVVTFQRENLVAYERLSPRWDGDWRSAPPVPTEAFRELDLAIGEPAPGHRVFRTSGTTGMARGRRRVPDLTLYEDAMEAPFVAQVLGGDTRPRPWLSMVPDPRRHQDSSLGYMVGILAQRLSQPDHVHWLMGAEGLNLAESWRLLEEAEAGAQPVVICATAFALVHLLDGAGDRSVSLPAGSRMMLTGGFKGQSRTLSEEDLLALTQELLGLEARDVVPEYGMCELTSQAYGRPLTCPPWMVMRIIDPWTGEEMAPGDTGIVAAFDLLALDNVSALLTGDRGFMDTQGGLTLLGRDPGAPPRGCSLSAEALGVAP